MNMVIAIKAKGITFFRNIINGLTSPWVSSRARKGDGKRTALAVKDGPDEGETLGCLYYLGNLLDEMEDYYKQIKKLKKEDRDSYLLYRGLGGQVSNSKVVYEAKAPNKYWLNKRPSFGIVHFNSKLRSKKRITPTLIYYRKIKDFKDIEFASGDVYRLSIFYGWDKKGRDRTASCSFPVEVSDRGKIRVLREVITEKAIVTWRGMKNGNYKVNNAFELRRKVYGYGGRFFLEGMVSEMDGWNTHNDVASFLFSIVANFTVNANAGIQVSASRGKVSCVFNVDMLRTPYFFKDRDFVVNENGNKKKIFHIVKTHKRRKGFFGHIFIKTHFRGLKKFNWQGYTVAIKSPKGLELVDFNSPGSPEGNRGSEEMGELLGKRIFG